MYVYRLYVFNSYMLKPCATVFFVKIILLHAIPTSLCLLHVMVSNRHANDEEEEEDEEEEMEEN